MITIKNRAQKDIVYAVFFGLISAILGFIQFKIPGYENSYTDLRETPLLIALVYISRPWYAIILSVISLISIPHDAPYLATFLFHSISLIATWYAYKWIEEKKFSNIIHGLATGAMVIGYYLVLIFPIMYLSYFILGTNTEQSFITAYPALVETSLFEIITTTLITSLFIVQFEIRKELEYQNQNLEKIVQARTFEIVNANQQLQVLNEELTASSEEVKSVNDNLERIVKERTKKINDQLTQLSKYAHMNSHEVRAPLARMLGIMLLLKVETNQTLRDDLLSKLYDSTEELDVVIKKMNRLLEQEIISSPTDLTA